MSLKGISMSEYLEKVNLYKLGYEDAKAGRKYGESITPKNQATEWTETLEDKELKHEQLNLF